jgi:PAS domain S-box-containing protein
MVDLDKVIQYSQDLNLLYVEDNDDAREMTAMILEEFFDNITLAVDGQDGFEKFKQNNIDLIITDINMPKLNGLEMCEKIRKIDKEVPMIVLSAHNEENFFTQSIEIGVNGYLLKPIDIAQLSTLIFQVIQKYKYIAEAKINMHLLKEYQKATNHSSIVSKTDLKGIITYVNDAFCEISGYTKEELIGKNHNIVRHPDNPKSIFEDMWHTIRDEKKIWKGIVRNKAKNTKSYYVDSLVMPIVDLKGNILEYISLRNDITDIMHPSKQLVSAVKNFQDAILVYIKLDKFDMIEEFYNNDTVEMIQDKVTHYLQDVFSSTCDFDKIYQLGHGEYAFLLDYTKYSHDENEFIDRLKAYQEEIKDQSIEVGSIVYDISILMSVVYEKNKILESAKLGIKKLLKTKKDFIIANNLANIEQQKARDNMRIVSMIKQAINNSKIVSYFQPIIDNKTKMVVKYESLVRLIDEDSNIVSPYYFLEASKKSNYYSQITNIVLEHSFDMLKHCKTDISINLSAIDIEQKTTREKILQLLEESKEESSRIVFELLEDEAIKNFNLIKDFITEVKKYGVQIAIDDFGAGYSNYERLLDYQPDILKIDGCLIRDIETSSYSLSAVKSIVTFAKEQNLQTVAEYIENESIFNIVKDLGIDYSQGYYFGKPEPLEHKESFA